MLKRTGLFTVTVLVVLLSLNLILINGVHAEEDVLRIRAFEGQDIETLDPAHTEGLEAYPLDLALYSKLKKYKPGSSETILGVADEFEVRKDGKEIYFKLKEGVQFQGNYGELTAEDVKFSFERMVDPEENSPFAGEWGSLQKVELTGKYSGKLIFEEPFAPLLAHTIPFSPGSIISKEAYEEKGKGFGTSPVGSGPYKWVKWVPEQKIVLEKFDDYYGEEPDFDRIEIYPMAEINTAEMAYERGELDATQISFNSIDRFKGMDDTNVKIVTPLLYEWVGFNMAKPPFDDIRVRKAVRYTINPEEIIEGAYNGYANRANTLLPPDVLGHWKDAPEYGTNLEKARNLLDKAGYPDGFKTKIYTTNREPLPDAITIAKYQLKKIGIDAEIVLLEGGSTYEKLGKEGPPGMHYMNYGPVTFDPFRHMQWFTSGQIPGWNFLRFSNEQYDRLAEEAKSEMDREERRELYVKMQKIMDEKVAGVWVTHGAYAWAIRDNIDPVFLAQTAQYHYWSLKD